MYVYNAHIIIYAYIKFFLYLYKKGFGEKKTRKRNSNNQKSERV